VDSVISYQPIKCLPASVSHNHQVYIIVTANFIDSLLLCRRSLVERRSWPQIRPTQKIWRGAPYVTDGQTDENAIALAASNTLNARQLHTISPHLIYLLIKDAKQRLNFFKITMKKLLLNSSLMHQI